MGKRVTLASGRNAGIWGDAETKWVLLPLHSVNGVSVPKCSRSVVSLQPQQVDVWLLGWATHSCTVNPDREAQPDVRCAAQRHCLREVSVDGVGRKALPAPEVPTDSSGLEFKEFTVGQVAQSPAA